MMGGGFRDDDNLCFRNSHQGLPSLSTSSPTYHLSIAIPDLPIRSHLPVFPPLSSSSTFQQFHICIHLPTTYYGESGLRQCLPPRTALPSARLIRLSILPSALSTNILRLRVSKGWVQISNCRKIYGSFVASLSLVLPASHHGI